MSFDPVNIKKFIAGMFLILTAAVLSQPSVSYAAEADQVPEEAVLPEYDPDDLYAGYQEIDVNVEQVQLDFSNPQTGDSIQPDAAEAISDEPEVLPAKYDPLSDPSLNFLPPLRNQFYGTCWAHSSLALAEINMIKQGYVSKNIDLSELQLSYFSYNFVEDPLGGTKGDVNATSSAYAKKVGGFFQVGGNFAFSSNVLASWIGAAKDEGELLTASIRDINNELAGLGDEYAYGHDVAFLSDYYVANYDIKDLAPVKELVRRYGGVGLSMYSDKSIHNSTYNSYYNSSVKKSNHAVTVIGWDDDFPSDSFNKNAPGDGAWLVRNSWTAVDGERSYLGYFWMSYYDASIQDKAVYSFVFDYGRQHDNNYQYDGGMWKVESGYSKCANVFTAHSDPENVDDEVIKAVAFGTDGANADVTIDIYVDLTNTSDPESGVKTCSINTTTDYAGYHTVTLEEPVRIYEGCDFSVVVTLKKTGGSIYMEKEYVSDTSWASIKTSALPGQSFAYQNGLWFDYGSKKNSNLCIKAFTDNVISGPYYFIEYNSNTEDPATFSDDSRHYTADDFVLKGPDLFGRTGYEITAWNTKADLTGERFEAGSTVSGLSDIKKSTVVLYAEWTPCSYDVTFNTAGGEIAEDQQDRITASYDSPYGTLPEVKKAGYDFTGWYLDPTLTIPVLPETVVSTASDHTLYAGWSIHKITVSFDPGEGSLPDEKKIKYVYYGSAYQSLPVPEYSGYEFTGWYDNKECVNLIKGTTKVTSADDHTLYAGWEESSSVPSYVPAKSIALEAKTAYLFPGESLCVGAATVPEEASKGLVWSLSDPAKGTLEYYIDCAVFTAGTGTGNVTLSAKTVNKKTAKINITILPTNEFDVTASSDAVATGKKLKLTAKSGKTKLKSEQLTWKVYNVSGEESTEAAVDAKGTFTAKTEGVYYVCAVNPMTGTRSGSFCVNAYVPVKKATLRFKTVTMYPGSSFKADVAVTPGDASSPYATGSSIGKDVSEEIVWALKNPADEEFAGVSADGVITAKKITGKTIYVTASYKPYAAKKQVTLNCAVKISSKEISSLKLDASSAVMEKGSTRKLECMSVPVLPGGCEIEWSSSNTQVATVDEEGNVTGVSSGTARITATLKSGRPARKPISASCSVRIK